MSKSSTILKLFEFHRNETLRKVIVVSVRILLGLYFSFFGYVKTIDPVGNSYRIEDMLQCLGLDFFLPLSMIMAMLFSAYQFAVGICLLLGANLRSTSIYAFLFLILLMPLSYLDMHGFFPDEGRVGLFYPFSKETEFYIHFLFFILCLFPVFWFKYNVKLYTHRTEWTVAIYSGFFSIFLSFLSYIFLPMWDLSPYKAGTDISEYLNKLEKPVNETKYFEEFETEDKHEDLKKISTSGYTFLLIANNIEETSTTMRKQINELYDYARQYDYNFYCLTSSDLASANIKEYIVESGGAEYPFIKADSLFLRALIRMNPGIVVAKDGVICSKWGQYSLPETNGESIENTKYAEVQETNGLAILLKTIILFYIPLIIVLIFDYLMLFVKYLWGRFRNIGKKEK